MKSNTFKKSLIFAQALVFLSGCSDSKLGKVSLDSVKSAIAGATTAYADDSSYLSADEKILAIDPSYTTKEVVELDDQREFNLQKWPATDCQPSEQNKQCAGVKLTHLAKVKIVSLVAIIDVQKSPWKELDEARYVQTLVVEAEKIVIRGKLRLPSTSVVLRSKNLIVEEGGAIDVTPISYPGQARFGFDPTNNPLRNEKGEVIQAAYDGKQGLPAAYIDVQTTNLDIRGNAKIPRFIADGGRGEAAGMGKGQTAEDFAANANPAIAMTIYGDSSGRFPDQAQRIIFSDKHSGLPWINGGCTTNKRSDETKCRRMYTSYPAVGNEAGWPADGTDAVAGGYPGAGGVGGHVRVISEVSDLSASIVSVEPGPQGTPDVLRKGSRPQEPFPAYKIRWRHVNNQPDDAYLESESVPRKIGADALGPQSPKSYSSAGKSEIVVSKNGARYSSSYFDLRLKRLRTLFISRDFDATVYFYNDTKAEYNLRFGSRDRLPFEFQDFDVNFKKIGALLLNQKDYFGRGKNDVPLYTFAFNSYLFQNELKQTLRSYYLYKYFEKAQLTSDQREQALLGIINQMKERLSTSQDQLQKTAVLLNNMDFQQKEIQKTQNGIQIMLDSIKKQIELKAKESIESRKNAAQFGKIISTAAAICKVIPVYQPMLAAAATVVEGMVNGPKDNSLEGWIEYAGDIKDGFDNLNSQKTLDASKKSFESFTSQFNYDKVASGNKQDAATYVFDLYKKIGPEVKKVTDAMKPLNQPVFGSDELSMEIKKIQSADPTFGPLFKELSKNIQILVDQKLKLQNDILTFTQISNQLLVDMHNYVIVAARTSQTVLKVKKSEDDVLKTLFSTLAQESEDKLMNIYSQLLASYEYVVMKPYNVQAKKLTPFEIRDKLNEALNESDEIKAVQLLEAFYMSQVGNLKSAMQTEIMTASRAVNTSIIPTSKFLTASEIKDLNKGYVDIELNSDFYLGKENIRIIDISVDSDYQFEFKNRDADSESSMRLTMELDPAGEIRLADFKKTYIYPKNELTNMFTWSHEFQFYGQSVPRSRPGVSSKFAGLIDFEVSNQEKAALFTSHAGITHLKLRKSSFGDAPTIKKLTLNIKYLYSE